MHATQVVDQAAAGRRLDHVIGHPLSDFDGLQEVTHEQELGQEVLALGHGDLEWGTNLSLRKKT